MRKLLFTFACLCVLASLARAQDPTYPTTYSRGGNLTTSSANCDPTACLGIGLPTPSAAVITVGLTGTWSGTLAVEESQDGGRTFTSAGASLTSTGTSSYVIAGFTSFRVRAGTLSSGNVGVNFTVSNAPSGGVTSGTGAPSGSCTANQIYVNQSNGNLYTCSAGSWVLSGGGGSGTVTNIATTGPITGGPITTTGTIACPTCTTSAAALANNAVVLGAGSQGTQTVASITTDGSHTLTLGGVGVGSGTIALLGNTSGTATITAPPVAGTAGNAITFSNAIQSNSVISSASGGFQSDVGHGFFWAGRSNMLSSADGIITFSNSANTSFSRFTLGPTTSSFPALCPSTLTVLVGRADGNCTTLEPLTASALTGNAYNTGTNCSSSASPAVCAAAAAGSVAIPTGATPTLVVNTTAVTANSQILLTIDEGLGTKLGVTCNTTLATLTQPVVTARTAATSFTIQIGSTLATNPACVSYMVLN